MGNKLLVPCSIVCISVLTVQLPLGPLLVLIHLVCGCVIPPEDHRESSFLFKSSEEKFSFGEGTEQAF